MNEFERVIRAFMAERGVGTLRELHAQLMAAGHVVDYDRLRRHLTGAGTKRGRDPRLNRALAEVLGLTGEERVRLALANLPGLIVR